MQFGFIASLVFAILVAVFALQNADTVSIDFLFAKIKVSQALVIFISSALGAVIVTILGLIRQVKLTMKIKEQNKRIKYLEEESLNAENKLESLLKSMEVIKKDTNEEKTKVNDKEQLDPNDSNKEIRTVRNDDINGSEDKEDNEV